MSIFQRHLAPIGLANMSHHRTGFYRVVLDKFGDGGIKAGLWIFKCATAFTFVKGNAPAIFMWPGSTTTLHQTGETKADIGRDVGAHPEQFAHG
ncbi:Uncharacterised protein [Shigella sonnei]|nr:Uncharacterised protein [Shigella sonnei]CSG41011.1 Uncharacterised protein [Shigella sonnei]CST02613.1 Uncharacterised protein [Shigella sonnei]